MVVPYLKELGPGEHFNADRFLDHDELGIFYENLRTFMENQLSVLFYNRCNRLDDETRQILIRGVWSEIVQILMRKMSTIFMPVVPDVFLRVGGGEIREFQKIIDFEYRHDVYVFVSFFDKDYRTTMEFIGHFESLLGSPEFVEEFRQSPLYMELMKRWQFKVYFHLR